ncbi:transposase family protein [Streptomyces longwoodensis]|uniref:transposase family protein n=1 Tax=Streptomyces longwoodensis TaxID=68231 RepID=UPI003402FD03
MDGTLIPDRDCQIAASSRNGRHSTNVQATVDGYTRLVVASARPAPSTQAHAHLWRESDLPAVAADTTVFADATYLGTGLIIPHRRRAGRHVLHGQEEDNVEHRRVHARVERAFARSKTWKIRCDCAGWVTASTTPSSR